MIVLSINLLSRQIDGIAPTFSKKPAIRQEDDGKRLLFECRIQADPKPTVAWFHNTNPVKDSPRHKVCTKYYFYLYFNLLVLHFIYSIIRVRNIVYELKFHYTDFKYT